MDEEKTRISKNLLEKRKGGLKNLQSMRRLRDGKKVCRKKEREMIETYGKQRRKDADFLSSIFYIFTLSYI
ncbi:hypothetical protein [Prevotella denticola]